MDHLTEGNFMMFAAKNYDMRSSCHSFEEFQEDLARVKYIKRLITRYKEGHELRERLILNHMIVMYNMFGAAATKILLFRTDTIWPILIPFMEYLGWLPRHVYDVGAHKVIETSRIERDQKVVEALSKL
jgi:hypothetical protein